MEHRKNEPPKTWFRSDRVFMENGEWFFHTREGIAVGPYLKRFEAEVDAGMLKSLLRDADPERAHAIIREFVLYADTAPRDVSATPRDLNDEAYTDYVVEEGVEALKPTTA